MTNPAPGFKEKPNHKVEITSFNGTLGIHAQGIKIATTENALTLKETSLPEVFYIPLRDVNQQILLESKTTSYCPFKGKASYWSIQTGDTNITDAAWEYKNPYDECLPLKGHVAFYPSKVDIVRS